MHQSFQDEEMVYLKMFSALPFLGVDSSSSASRAYTGWGHRMFLYASSAQ